jgi:hypothetical protein
MNWIVKVGNWNSSNYSWISIINGVDENGNAQVLKFFFFVWMQWKERATTSTYKNAIIVCDPSIFYTSCKNYIKTSQMLLSINNEIICNAFNRD